jgi:DNA-binding response OmpR family regulator
MRFIYPRRPSASATAPEASGVLTAEPATPEGAMSRRRILLIDDDVDMRALLNVTLQDAGFEAFGHADGTNVIQAALTLRPAVVILDWMLPRSSGIEVCAALREHPDLRTTGIIMVSAKGRDSDVEAGYEAGADRYFVKPVVPRVLVRHVRELAEERG